MQEQDPEKADQFIKRLVLTRQKFTDKPLVFVDRLCTAMGRFALSIYQLQIIFSRVLILLSNEPLQDHLNKMPLNACLIIKKSAEIEHVIRQPNIGLVISDPSIPRTLVIKRNPEDGMLHLLAMTLSKSYNNSKIPVEERVQAQGKDKSYKVVLRIDDYSAIKLDYARLKVSLGTNLNQVLQKYESLSKEVLLAQRFIDNPHVSVTSLSSIFPKRDVNGNIEWVTYVYDKNGICLDDIIKGKYSLDKTMAEIITHNLISQIIRAVCVLHESKVAHRDIKPSNFIVDKAVGFNVRITDFGLALDLEYARVITAEFLRLLGYQIETLEKGALLNPQRAHYVMDCLRQSIDEFYAKNTDAAERLNDIRLENSDEAPSLNSLKSRIRVFERLIGVTSLINDKIDILYPISAGEYAAPEIFAYHLETPSSPFYDYYTAVPDHAYGKQLYLSNKETAALKSVNHRPDFKQDSFALGITIYYLLYKSKPDLNKEQDLDNIHRVPVLNGLLAFNPAERINVQDAFNVWHNKSEDLNASRKRNLMI